MDCRIHQKCQQQKKLCRKSLLSWQRKVPLLVGLETLLMVNLSENCKYEQLRETNSENEPIDWTFCQDGPLCLADDTQNDDVINNIGMLPPLHERDFSTLATSVDEQTEPLDLSRAVDDNYVFTEWNKNQHTSTGGGGTMATITTTTTTSSSVAATTTGAGATVPISQNEWRASLDHCNSSSSNNNVIRNNKVNFKRIYTEDDVTRAMTAICNGQVGTRRAAAVYGIPRSTLRNKICKLHDLKRKEELLCGRQLSLVDMLSTMTEEENSLVHTKHHREENNKRVDVGGASLCQQQQQQQHVSPPQNNSQPHRAADSQNGTIKRLAANSLASFSGYSPAANVSTCLPPPPPPDEEVTEPKRSRLTTTSDCFDHSFSGSIIPSDFTEAMLDEQGAYFQDYLRLAQQFLLPFLPYFMSSFLKDNVGSQDVEVDDKLTPNGHDHHLQRDAIVNTNPFSVSNLLGKAASSSPGTDEILTHFPNNLLVDEEINKELDSEPPQSTSNNSASINNTTTTTCKEDKQQNIIQFSTIVPRNDNKSSAQETTSSAASNHASSAADNQQSKNRAKRGHYRRYNSDSLKEAVKAVQSGAMSVHKAGSFYGVPHSTLEYKVKERHLSKPSKKLRPSDIATQREKTCS